ncbi:DNA-binding transcriptional activator of the SARP family [Microbacterium sp. cf046]|uniref:BTAD domain-containing putative transcriptional regulator n=1 Tax=Microbacterium sp. cf046 TaxID=1761803 RepID=UPI0008E1015E|nr:BTAD domain-containing putative transcriptional regulator [Microbacterium sp. cf046]SFR93346.1 DNA-binding transcriptional activator of the SARP family [Microbacterium sp. cf046]
MVAIIDRPSLTVQLLGRPRILRSAGEAYEFRSRKSWAVLAYLLLSERAPSRAHLTGMLFGEADDPARALRWCLAEIRRGLGDDAALDGDPVTVALPSDAVVDVQVLIRGTWEEAVRLPGVGAELLDGLAPRYAGAYETWLISQQRHVAAVSEAVLHEAALGSMSGGDLNAALGYALRASTMSPLDENHQALLIRLYRLAGDDEAAERQYAACRELFHRELGVPPGPAIDAAYRERVHVDASAFDEVTIDALIEAGSAAAAAGSIEAGIESLGLAAELADRADDPPRRVTTRLALAEALIHGLGGLDEQGLSRLYEADEIARTHRLRAAVAEIRAELGYVDFLRARYDRAERWLTDALTYADDAPKIRAKATTYLGAVASDRGDLDRARRLLESAADMSEAAGAPRQQAYGLAMLGRVELLSGRSAAAEAWLARSMAVAQHDHWLAFLPWPQAILGEVKLVQGDLTAAAAVLEQAFARACQLRDPCWEGMSARALALVAEARGETDRAFAIMIDALARCNRLADPYVWLEGYILDALCRLGCAHGHPETPEWTDALHLLTDRTRMLVQRAPEPGGSRD